VEGAPSARVRSGPMSTHAGHAKRLGCSLGLVLCSLGGGASADGAIATAPEVVAYCEGRTVALPQGERDLAAAGCRIMAAGAAESLTHHDLASAIDQLRALDERMKQRVAPPAPVQCPTPSPCPSPSPPACPAPRVCPSPSSEPVAHEPSCLRRPTLKGGSTDRAQLEPRPPRPPRPISSPARVRHPPDDRRNPFDDAAVVSTDTSDGKMDPFTPAKPVERPTRPSAQKHRGRDLMDPFPRSRPDEPF